MTRRIMVVHPPFGPYGGGELVAAWVVQALARDHRVTMVCIDPVNWLAIDARFGTTLAPLEVPVATFPPAWRRLVRAWPHLAAQLRWAVIERLSAGRVRPERGDLWMSTCNEMRLPAAGVQYVHFPTPGLRADDRPAGRSGVTGARNAYHRVCRHVAGAALCDFRHHATLVNSQFTAAAWRRLHAEPAKVVYPPVPPLVAAAPSPERLDRVVCVGRLFSGKGLERVVRIIEGVRARGANVTLAIAGQWDCGRTERQHLEQFFHTRPWIELYENPSRADLATLVASSRYGIHGMTHEPFGIAVAELQGSGAVTFAPAIGGAREIIEDERLLYRDETDAVDKFMRVRSDRTLQDELRQCALARADRFAPGRFMDQIRALVVSAQSGPV